MEPDLRFGINDVRNPYLSEWFDKQSLELAGNVSATTTEAVREKIRYGLDNRLSVPDTAREVSSVFEDAKGRRAQMIARTELNKSANGASWAQAQGTGVVKTKTWLATADARTRPEHMALDGETVGIDEPFSNGSMFPDDVNCRCTLTYGIDEAALRGEPEPVEEEVAYPVIETKQDAEDALRALGVEEISLGRNLAVADDVIRGLTDLKRMGRMMPTRVSIQAKPFGGRKDIPARFTWNGEERRGRIIPDPDSGILEINPTSDYYKDKAGTAKEMRDSGFWSTDHEYGTIYHEMGHYEHFKKDPDSYASLRMNPSIPYEDQMALMDEMAEPSRYAMTQKLEFVAEVYAGRMAGETYPPTVMTLYEKWGGPEL